MITWNNVGFPHLRGEVAHPNTTIDRQSARLEVANPGSCVGLRGQETITVDIARPLGNHYEMVACLRGPGLAANETLVREMVSSVRVTG